MYRLLPFLLLACHEQLPDDVFDGGRDARTRAVVDVESPDDGARDGGQPDAAPSFPDFAGVDAADARPDVPDTAPAPDAAPVGLGVGCLTHDDCAPDELCCTRAHAHESNCLPQADCPGGQRDACLTDTQCAARRPNWSTCCHDRAARDYCAPSPETCQPLIACRAPADCPASEPCCSWHGFYQAEYCTSPFFAVSAGDCP